MVYWTPQFLFCAKETLKMFLTIALLCVLNALAAFAQLSGSVGPTTSRASKQATICSVLSYGGSVGSSVSGIAVLSEFA